MSNQKIKLALWGIGRAGWKMHRTELECFKDMFEIAGGYDIIPERMTKLQELYPGCKSYPSADAMLADPEIEVVAVTVRSKDHVDFDIRVLEAGKVCVAEKPVALNYADALRLKAAADRFPGKLFCRHNRRFETCFHHVQEIIASGVLGDVYEIKLSRHNYNRRTDWQVFKDEGGGILNNWGPHLIDHALRFINAPLESVWSDMKQIAAMGDAEDHVKAVLRGTNGVTVDIEISGGVALPAPVYAVYGTRGSLVSVNEKTIQLKYLDMEKTEPPEPASHETQELPGTYAGRSPMTWIEKTIDTAPASGVKITDFYRYVYEAVRENKPYPISIDEAVEVVRVSDIIRAGGMK